MTLIAHALTDLIAQRDALLHEFDAWGQRASLDGDLGQHHSQVVRITDTLRGVLAQTLAGTDLAEILDSSTPASAPIDTTSLDELADRRRLMGSVHLLWDFFRDKFAQRDTHLFTYHLGAADDLAWDIYRAFWERAIAAAEASAAARSSAPPAPGQETALSPAKLKEPPLIFYHVERNYLAQPRVSSFSVPGFAGKDVKQFYFALRKLPVPIIGMPWYQAGRLPALVFVGHEVGHVVAEDLDLDEEFDRLIASLGMDDDRTRIWRAWADEIFADLIGTLALGSAYVEQLAVELADGYAAVIGDPVNPKRPGAYPTRALRIALCTHALEKVGAPIERPFFADAFPIGGDSDRYIADVPHVVRVLMDGPYERLGGAGLNTVLDWKCEREAQVEERAAEMLECLPTGLAFSVRTWVAAAARARLRDATRYATSKLDDLAQAIVAHRARGVRADQGETLRERLFQVGADPSGFSVRPTLSDLDRGIGGEIALSLEF